MNKNSRDETGHFPKTHVHMVAAASMVALLFYARQPRAGTSVLCPRLPTSQTCVVLQ